MSRTDDPPFEPDEWECQRYDDERIKLCFRADDGRSQSVIVPRSAVPPLIERLVAEIGPGQGAAMSLSSLRPGRTFLVQGFGVRRHSDGSAALTLFVHLSDEDRDVKIPLELSAENLADLLRQLH